MFDPLHKWLGIPPHEQPPDHYRLLGLKRFELDREVINIAADKQLNYLHRFENSEHAVLAADVANQVSMARLCLLDPQKREAYDECLRSPGKSAQPAATIAPTIVVSAEVSSPSSQRAAGTSKATKAAESNQSVELDSRAYDMAKVMQKGKQLASRLPVVPSVVVLTALPCLVIGILVGRLFLAGGHASPVTPNDVRELANASRSENAAAGVGNSSSSRSGDSRNAAVSRQPRPVFERVPLPVPADTDAVRREFAERFPADATVNVQVGDMAAPPTAQQLQVRKKLGQQARELRQIGDRSHDDSAVRFAAWALASQRYLESNDYQSALEVTADIDAAFHDVDLLRKQGAILSLASLHLQADQAPKFLEEVVRYGESCLEAERFELCEQYCQPVLARAFRLKPRPNTQALGSFLARCSSERRWYQDYQGAIRTLSTQPQDPDANVTAGEYLAAGRAKWSEALPYFTRCSDQALKEAAEKELDYVERKESPLGVGDAWLKASRAKGFRRNRIPYMLRALDWYRLTVRDSSVEEREKAVMGIAELNAILRPDMIDFERAPLKPGG
ncbi:MAG: hypothetical protein ACR2NZ_03055 [Rubripirellula sp.]